MTNVQLYLAYIVPTVLILLGVIMNHSDNAALRSEMVQLHDSIYRDMVMLHERVATVEARYQK